MYIQQSAKISLLIIKKEMVNYKDKVLLFQSKETAANPDTSVSCSDFDRSEVL